MAIISALGDFGILSAAIAILVKIVFDRRARQISTFHKYSALYAEIMSEILWIGTLYRPFPIDSGKDRALVLRLFFLLSEEKFLFDSGLLNAKVWSIWDSGLKVLMRHRYLIEAWEFCRSQCDFEGEFATLVQ